MTQLQTYHYTEWDTTFQLRQIGKVEVLSMQQACALLNELSAPQAEHTPESIITHVISKFDKYEGYIYMLYNEFGVIKFRMGHYVSKPNGELLNMILFDKIATEQLIIDLCEMSDTQAEEQIGQIFEDSLSWI